jgi:hypothetical protein
MVETRPIMKPGFEIRYPLLAIKLGARRRMPASEAAFPHDLWLQLAACSLILLPKPAIQSRDCQTMPVRSDPTLYNLGPSRTSGKRAVT